MKIFKVQRAKWKRFWHIFPFLFRLRKLRHHRMVDFYSVTYVLVLGFRIPVLRVHQSVECDCGKVFYRTKSFTKSIMKNSR